MRTATGFLSVIAMLAMTAAPGCGSTGANRPATHPSEASKPPSQILADAEAAIGHVRSFHIEASGRDLHDGAMKLSGDFGIPGKLHIRLKQGSGVAEVVLVDGNDYLKANRAFLTAQKSPAKVVALLAERWVKLPVAAAAGIQEFNAWTSPATVGRCIVGNHLGTIGFGGMSSIGARPVVVLAARGDAPGSSPGRLYVAATGPPLPLRAVQTGLGKPGGKPDRVCNETHVSADTTQSSDLRFSRYNSPVSVTAPSGALDLQKLSGGQSGAAPARARPLRPGAAVAAATPLAEKAARPRADPRPRWPWVQGL